MIQKTIPECYWQLILDAFGGVEGLTLSAKLYKACQRWRGVKNGEVLLRLVLSYCLGDMGLRSTVAWAASVNLADISNTALLKRLALCEGWLKYLVGKLLAVPAAKAGKGRLIRLVDGTSVVRAGAAAKKSNELWRIHSVFDLPAERFSFFELTDEKIGERLNMAPVVHGEIRIGDRAYLQPDRISAVIEAGGDVVVRAAWTNAHWTNAEGKTVDLAAILRKGVKAGKIDRPIWIKAKSGKTLDVRLVAVLKPKAEADKAIRKILAEAKKKKRKIKPGTLDAAKWVIIVTTLRTEEFPSEAVLELYRLRWRIELAFKRLKSLIGLKSPPGVDTAKPWILAHLLMILLIEPLTSELDVSPRWKMAA